MHLLHSGKLKISHKIIEKKRKQTPSNQEKRITQINELIKLKPDAEYCRPILQ